VKSRRGIAAIGTGLLLAGCASVPGSCPGGRTDGWLSGWGTGGAGAFTLGLRRAWACDPASNATPLGPAPSADPTAQWPMSPSSATPPR